MPAPASPQLRFLLRASLLFLSMLALWWFVLLGPMLDGVRLSTSLALRLLALGSDNGSVSVGSNGDWIVRVPMPEFLAKKDAVQRTFGRAPGASPVKVRSFKLAIAQRIPTFFTLTFPLFWAVMLAGPWSHRLGRLIGSGTALLWLLATLSLLLYTLYSIATNMALIAAGLPKVLWDGVEYLNVNVVPYAAPVLLALWLHRDLRRQIFSWDAPVPSESQAVEPDKPRRGRYRAK